MLSTADRPLLRHTVHRDHPGGEWVVLVHGAGVTSEIWDEQIEEYRETYNLLLPDLRGHGASADLGGPDAPPYTWEQLAREVLAVLDHHGIESAHFLAVSMGTIVTRTLAELAPERIRSMVNAGAIVRLNPLARFLIGAAHALKRLVPHMWLYRVNAWIIMPRPSHRDSRRLVASQARRLARDEFIRWLDVTRGLPARLDRYAATDPGIPTLYVMGDQDHMFLPGAADVAAHQGSARLHVIDDCGHVCTAQRPDAFNRVSLAFLAG